jgi:hypothetical protein
MSTRTVRFGDLIEMIDRLPLDERASLVEVVRQRIADDERSRIAASIRAARREHARGRCKPVTPEDLMREILQ